MEVVMEFPLNESILQTKKERPMIKWTVVTRSIIVLLMMQIILGTLSALIILFLSSDAGPEEWTGNFDFYFSLYGSLFNLITILILSLYVENRSWKSLGWSSSSSLKKHSRIIILALLILLAFTAFNLLTGFMRIEWNDNFHPGLFLLTIVGFFIQAASQEFIFRGYIMNGLSVDGRILQGIWVNSLMLALIFIVNNQLSLFGTLNILLFSGVLSYLFYFTSDIKVTILINAAVQIFFGPLLGSNFQGQDIPASLFISYLQTSQERMPMDQDITVTITLLVLITFLHTKLYQRQLNEK